MYGLNSEKREKALKKLEKQKAFLNSHYVDMPTGDKIPLINLFKNAYINPQRYIAEANQRVWALYGYAKQRNLTNVFVTLTLPSQYHPYRTIGRKKVKNRAFNGIPPREASKKLSEYLSLITSNDIYSKIPKNDRCYFRSIEPHKSGVPHTHVSFFIPEERVQAFKEMLERYSVRWKTQIHIETEVRNPVSYVMKYILKSFDDLRVGGKGITDLSLWYIYHGIPRFYTSRTMISLSVYRKLNGRYTIFELTEMRKNGALGVFLDENNDIAMIQNEYEVLYYRKGLRVRSFDAPLRPGRFKFSLKSQNKPPKPKNRCLVEFEGEKQIYELHKGQLKPYFKPIAGMTDIELLDYRRELLRSRGDPHLIYLSERNLIRRKLLQKFSPQAMEYKYFWDNHDFSVPIQEEIPF